MKIINTADPLMAAVLRTAAEMDLRRDARMGLIMPAVLEVARRKLAAASDLWVCRRRTASELAAAVFELAVDGD